MATIRGQEIALYDIGLTRKDDIQGGLLIMNMEAWLLIENDTAFIDKEGNVDVTNEGNYSILYPEDYMHSSKDAYFLEDNFPCYKWNYNYIKRKVTRIEYDYTFYDDETFEDVDSYDRLKDLGMM